MSVHSLSPGKPHSCRPFLGGFPERLENASVLVVHDSRSGRESNARSEGKHLSAKFQVFPVGACRKAARRLCQIAPHGQVACSRIVSHVDDRSWVSRTGRP